MIEGKNSLDKSYVLAMEEAMTKNARSHVKWKKLIEELKTNQMFGRSDVRANIFRRITAIHEKSACPHTHNPPPNF
jgi:hypothetical protein